ncbi:uncharacterized protein AB9X84_014528 [Acanthopagrus schlegelii]
MLDSEDEDEDDHSRLEETCLVTGFLRDYIENGSSQELHQLLKFLTGWSIPPQHPYRHSEGLPFLCPEPSSSSEKLHQCVNSYSTRGLWIQMRNDGSRSQY